MVTARVGKKAPDFEASAYVQGEGFKNIKLSDYLGRWVVVYFYPRDDTPGCTAEACAFRDDISREAPQFPVQLLLKVPAAPASSSRWRISDWLTPPDCILSRMAIRASSSWAAATAPSRRTRWGSRRSDSGWQQRSTIRSRKVSSAS